MEVGKSVQIDLARVSLSCPLVPVCFSHFSSRVCLCSAWCMDREALRLLWVFVFSAGPHRRGPAPVPFPGSPVFRHLSSRAQPGGSSPPLPWQPRCPAQWVCSQPSSSCRGLRGWWRPAVPHPSNTDLWQAMEMHRRSRPKLWPAASLLERGGGLESWWEQRETPEKGTGVQFCLEASQRTGRSDAWAVFLEGGQGKVKSRPTFPRF